MWDHLTPADIERVKHRLAVSRAEMLSRHAEELKELDAQQDELEALERLVSGFAQKYLASDTASSNDAWISKQTNGPVPADLAHNPAPETHQHDVSSGGLQVRQQISPNFATPPRLRRFVGG
jgi:hypothetical protein